MAFARQNPHLFTSTNANKASIDTELNTQTQWINATDKKIDDVAAAGIPGVTDLSNIGKIPFTDGYTIEWGKLTLDYVQPASLNETIFQDSSITQRVLGNICVGTPQLQASCVIAEKLALNSVTPTKIPENSIPVSKLRSNGHACFLIGNSNDHTYNELVATAYQIPTGLPGGTAPSMQPLSVIWNAQTNNSLSGNKIALKGLVGGQLADSTITATQIADANVTTAKIANNAVTTTKIADANVTTTKIANNAVTTAKIADANVTTAKIANNSIITSHLVNNAVTGDKVADLTLPYTALQAAGSVSMLASRTDFNNGRIYAMIMTDWCVPVTRPGQPYVSSVALNEVFNNSANNAFNGVKLQNATIDGAKLIDNSVNGSKMVNSTVSGSKLIDGSVSTTKLSGTAQFIPFAMGYYVASGGLQKGIGVQSVAPISTGMYQVTFNAEANDANYIVLLGADNPNSPGAIYSAEVFSRTTTGFIIRTGFNNTAVASSFNFLVYEF
jgi:hypothetical protein